MCGSKTTAQQNTSSTYSPPPQVLQNYQQVTQQAQGVAATPYQAYGSQLVAPVNNQQQTGIAAVNSASGIQDPYNAGSAGLAGAASTAINPNTVTNSQIEQYESPYNSDVINATEAEIQNQNQQQSAALQGNTISSGAFGGDRAGIAQAALAGQQDIASNATIAGLENQNYSQALGEANTQQQAGLTAQEETAQNRLGASTQLGNLGSAAQTEALNEANAQTNAGTLEQTTQQAQDTAAYNQFLQQQAYPFETTGWLANIVEGIGSQSGGTSTGQTTQQGSAGSQLLGAGLGLASFLHRGGRIPHRAAGGGLASSIILPPYDLTGGSGPQGIGGGSFVPATSPLAVGNTMPKGAGPSMPAAPTAAQQGQGIAQTAQAVQKLGDAAPGLLGGLSNDYAALTGGLSGSDFEGMARGGGIASRRHFDDGGGISPDLAYNLDQIDAQTTPSAGLASAAGAPPAPASQGLASGANVSASDYGMVPGSSGIVPTPAGLAAAPQTVPADSGMGFDLTPAAPSAGLASAGNAPVPAGLASGANTAAGPPVGLNSQARGMRNNNPGNLIANEWTQGLPGYAGSDGRFAIFSTPEQGAAALDRNLQSYSASGVATPLQIASKWAPAGDGNNNPVSYAGVIAKAAGVGINDPIDLGDPAQRAKVSSAISLVENGRGSGIASATGQGGIASATGAATGAQGGIASTAGLNPDLPAPGAQAAQGIGFPPGLLGGNGTSPSGTGDLLGLSPDTRELLLAAGLGIMSGTSRSALVNVGQGGLAGIQAVNQLRNTSSEIGLRNAQTYGAMTDAQIKQQQLGLMMKALDQNSKIFAGEPAATPSVTTPTVTAPTVAPKAGGPGAPAAATSTAPGFSAPVSQGAQSAKTVSPQYDPVRLRRAAENMSFVNPAVAQNYRDQAQAIESGTAMVQFTDGSWGKMPGFNEAAAGTEAAKTAAEEAAKNAALPSVDPATGAKYVGANGAPVNMPVSAAGPTSSARSFSVDPETAAVHTAVPPAPPGGGYIVPNLPPGAKLTDLPPATQAQMTQDGEFLKNQDAVAQSTDSAIARSQALAQAFKNFQSGTGADKLASAAALAKSFGQPDIAQAILRGEYGPDGAQWVDKEGVNSVLDTLKQATPRFAQSEFNKIEEYGTPNTTNLPQANHEMVAEMLALSERNKDFQTDWQTAKQQGWTSPSAFYTAWRNANPLNGYIKSAQRQIGNFAGMDLPPSKDWASGAVYVAPAKPTPATGALLKRYGIQPGAMFRFNGRSSSTPIQPISKADAFSAQLGTQ